MIVQEEFSGAATVAYGASNAPSNFLQGMHTSKPVRDTNVKILFFIRKITRILNYNYHAEYLHLTSSK